MNENFCILPFIHYHINPEQKQQLCCIAKENPAANEVSFNSEYLKSTRLQLLNGERPKDCSLCYYFDDSGISSYRKLNNENYKDKIDEAIASTDKNTGEISVDPIFFDVRTVICNLKCVSCGPQNSSSHKKIEFYNKGLKHSQKPNTSVQIQDIFENSLDTVLMVYWAGGEPFFSPTHWKIMKKIAELPDERKKEIRFWYNTNLTLLNWKNINIPKFLSQFEDLYIGASIDGIEDVAEYTRNGIKWAEIEKNLREYFNVLGPERFGIAIVLSLPVILDLRRALDYFDKIGIKLIEPQKLLGSLSNMLDIQILPTEMFEKVIHTARNSLVDYENTYVKDKIERILAEYEALHNAEKYSESQAKMSKLMNREREVKIGTPSTIGTLFAKLDKEVSQWYESL